MHKIENIIVFDTEFVSCKKGSQPLQVAFQAYELVENELSIVSDFSVYIRPINGIPVTEFFKKYTGISEEILKNDGLMIEKAKEQVIEYLSNFDKKNTVLLGWDVSNDLIMFNKLFCYNEDSLDIQEFRWLDLSRIYAKLHNIKENPALEKACKEYNIVDKFHNAQKDVVNTAKLLELLIDKFGIDEVLYQSKETKIGEKIKEKRTIVK